MAIVIPYLHEAPVFGGGIQKFDSDGCVTWTKESFRRLEGSFDEATMIQTEFRTKAQDRMLVRYYQHGEAARFTHLKIEGSPAKFLQGHNLFGSENLIALVALWVQESIRCADLEFTPELLGTLLRGDYTIHRVDVAVMCDVGHEHAVLECLGALSDKATVAHKGRGTKWGTGSLLFGSRATRTTTIKAYGKFDECTRVHPMHDDILHREGLKNYARGAVRFEVECHSKWLDQKGLRQASAWHTDTAAAVYEEVMSKLNISGNMPLTPNAIRDLDASIQRTYYSWVSGANVRQVFGRKGKSTFYRHRNTLKEHGIDIDVTYSPEHKPVVISLAQVIRPTPKPIPQWAYGTVLLAAA